MRYPQLYERCAEKFTAWRNYAAEQGFFAMRQSGSPIVAKKGR